jgi:hypothetical protein
MRLSEEYVLAKTRAESLREVRNLNLWGNSITDVSVRAAPRMRFIPNIVSHNGECVKR